MKQLPPPYSFEVFAEKVQEESRKMTKLIWMTDIHLNFVETERRDLFFEQIATSEPDRVLIGGDIAEAPTIEKFLRLIAQVIKCPIYFVLGNHDYYFSDVSTVRCSIRNLCNENAQLIYLTGQPPIPLSDQVGLIGDDGWADGRCGDFLASTVFLNDYRLIQDLVYDDPVERLSALQHLADEAAERISQVLNDALTRFDHIYFLTHVPPFLESCWHEGKTSDTNWSPHFCSKIIGDGLMAHLQNYPDKRLTVLCGHTHGDGFSKISKNIEVFTGGAVYGKPQINREFRV